MVSTELFSFIESLKKVNKQVLIIIPENYYYGLDEVENCLFYPDFDIFPFENLDVSANIKAQRIKVLYSLAKNKKVTILTTLSALSRFTVPKKDFIIKKYKIGEKLDLSSDEIYKLGYILSEEVNSPGDYAKRGFVRDIYIPLYEEPVRIELFDTEIDRVTLFDIYSQRSIKSLKEFEIVPGSEIQKYDENIDLFVERMSRYALETKQNSISMDNLNSIPSFFIKIKIAS